MDLRELGYFLAVFEERSVTAAARRCHVSQPSVSEALASLEETLSVRLFVRHRKGATPTAEGERLYPVARGLVEGARSLPSLFAPEAGRRVVVLGLMRSLDVTRTRRLLASLAKDADLELRVVDADEPCDVRLVSRPMRTEGEVFEPLWEERYVVALPKDHALARLPALRGSDLAGAKLVARCHCEAQAQLSPASAKLDVVAVASSEEWAIALVAAGLGIAILPEGVVPRGSGVVTRRIRGVHAKREVGVAHGGANGRRKGAASSLLVADVVARLRG